MRCTVTILADSVAPNGSRLTTFEVEHWRAIHAEVLRHRSFSFSAASSRAIPGGRMAKYVEEKPAFPTAWTTAKKGMQGGEPLDPAKAKWAASEWYDVAEKAIGAASRLDGIGVHKSISNRLLEPFAHIRCVITTAEPGLINFFAQRLHWAAEPAMQQLAKRMALAYEVSTPRRLEAGEWHLPYITEEDWSPSILDDMGRHLARISAARCARVSYKTHDGKIPSHTDDYALFERLVGSDPKHASPTEHQAMADRKLDGPSRLNGNLGPGWIQHRKLIPGERATAETFDLAARLALYGDADFLLEDPHR